MVSTLQGHWLTLNGVGFGGPAACHFHDVSGRYPPYYDVVRQDRRHLRDALKEAFNSSLEELVKGPRRTNGLANRDPPPLG